MYIKRFCASQFTAENSFFRVPPENLSHFHAAFHEIGEDGQGTDGSVTNLHPGREKKNLKMLFLFELDL